MSNTGLITPIVIDALAKSLFYGPPWSFGLYFASGLTFFGVAATTGGLAWLETVFSPREMRQLLPRRDIKSATPETSNIIPFRKRRTHGSAVKQPMEAAE